MARVKASLLAVLLMLGLVIVGCTSPSSSSPAAPTSPSPTTASNTTGSSSLPSITEVVETVKPAVVSVIVGTVSYNIFLQPVPTEQAGSGVIIDEQGYIVTVGCVNYPPVMLHSI